MRTEAEIRKRLHDLKSASGFNEAKGGFLATVITGLTVKPQIDILEWVLAEVQSTELVKSRAVEASIRIEDSEIQALVSRLESDGTDDKEP
jgi:hypothetical protein